MNSKNNAMRICGAASLLAASIVAGSGQASAKAPLSLFDSGRLMEARHADNNARLKAQGMNVSNAGAFSISEMPEVQLHVDETRKVGVILELAEDFDIAELENAELTDIDMIGRYCTGRVSIDNVEMLSNTDAVKQIKLARRVKLHNDAARKSSSVDEVHSGVPAQNLSAITGENVIVGLMDSGLDPMHINFNDAEGNSRIKYAWKFNASGTAREYTTDMLPNFGYDNTSETHATHVLGIMTGSWTRTDRGADYSGVAPGADIVACCGPDLALTDQNILTAIKNISTYAKEAGKPCVINLSLGDNYGPHDGTDAFTAAINEVGADDNTTIFMSAGNEQDQKIAVVKEFTADEPTMKTVLWRVSTFAGSQNTQSQGFVDIWGSDNRPLKVYLDLIENGESETPVKSWEVPMNSEYYVGQGSKFLEYGIDMPDLNDKDFTAQYTQSVLGGYAEICDFNNRFHAELISHLTRKSTSKNNPYIALRVEGEPGQKVFIYSSGYYVAFTDNKYPGYTDGGAEGSNSNMGSGKETISVGSYATKNIAPYTQTLGTLSFFSSYGTLADGRVMPDICAPGQTIISSESYATKSLFGYDDTSTVNGSTYYWLGMPGTSMASPHAAGVGALMLSVNPNLTTSDIRRIMKETANPFPEGTVGGGAGKVNALAAVMKAAEESGISTITDNTKGDIAVEATGRNIYTVLSPNEGRSTVTVTNMAGTTMKVQGSDETTTTVDLNDLNAGIYLLTVEGGKTQHTVKVVVK